MDSLVLVFLLVLLFALLFGGIALHALWYAAVIVLIVAGVIYVFDRSRGPRI